MPKDTKFLDKIVAELTEDRLTWQRGIPTLHPENLAEASTIFKFANEHKQRLFVTGFGNNIDPIGEKFAGFVAVKSDRLNSIVQIAPGDYFVTVGAGYPIRHLNRALAKYDLFFPMADLPYVGSIGGALAVGLSADYKGHHLPISRYFIMGEIADPRGEALKPGSRCFKSVAGFDIIKIFSPSWGQLGMIVTATLRVLPLTEHPEYEKIYQHSIDYDKFVKIYKDPGDNVSAQYSLKVKAKFDPNGVLPLV